MSNDTDTDDVWQGYENLLLTCPDCGRRVALDTDVAEFGGARCVDCDERMEYETK